MTVATRAIIIIPKVESLTRVQAFRKQYDPLADLIPPHITLVFPFESQLSALEMKKHAEQAVQGLPTFPIVLKGVTGAQDEYLFLNVKHGNDRLIELHDRLYTGPLAPYYSREHTFVPHLTVGRLTGRAAFADALEASQELTGVFQAAVKEVVICRLNSADLVENTIWL